MCFHEIRVIFFFTSQHKDVFFPGSREAVSGRGRAGRLQKVEYWALICCCVTLAKNSPGQGPSILIYKMRFFDGEQSFSRDFPGSSAGKESTCNTGDLSSIAGSRSSPGEGISYPLQYSWASLPAIQETWVPSLGWEDPLEEGMATHSSILAWRIPMDRGAWQATVHGVTKSWIQLSD